MSALVRKEIRLLLPAWIAAMLLVMAPILLGRLIDENDPIGVTNMLTAFGVAIGCVILGLAGMGREISSHTFSLLLAQPRPRAEYWRAKLGVLLASLIPLALFLSLMNLQFVPQGDRWDMAGFWFITACVAVTGGLWTTLLFRQIVAAFWISVVLPFAILATTLQVDDERVRTILTIVLMLAYSVAGYCFAHWQFRHAQDTAWTGGDVSLPSIAHWLPWKRTATAIQTSHPYRALLGKEFQFQQVNFLLGGLLVLVQVVVLLLQKFADRTEPSVLEMIAENFWGIWILMPLLVGCGSVAEERKLGTLEPQLCLPVSRAWQFAIKALVTLVCGIILGALVPVALSVFNPGRGMNWREFALPWTLTCASLALVSLYASSLTHQMLQALGAGIGIIVTFLFLGNVLAGTFSRGHDGLSMFGVSLWRGPLILIIAPSVMLLFTMVLTWRRLRSVWLGFLAVLVLGLWGGQIQALYAFCVTSASQDYTFKPIAASGVVAALCPVALTLALAAQNYKHTQTSLALWWRNAAIWLGCFLLTGVVTWLVYNRAWELAMRFEPAAGAPRLSGEMRPVITGQLFGEGPTFVLLPDGRLSSFRGYEHIPGPLPASGPEWRMIKTPRMEFVGGSNWTAIGSSAREFAGVKSDGTLWRACWLEQVDRQGNATPFHAGSPRQKDATMRSTGLKFERIGSEATWASIAASWSHFVALQRDGTIWGWGDNSNKQLGDGPKAITNTPVQLDPASNWTAVYAGAGYSYAVNREGEIWKWGKFSTDIYQRTIQEGPVRLSIKVPGVRSIAGQNNLDLILDTEGNLWGLGIIPPAFRGGGTGMQYFAKPRQLGTNWLHFSCGWQGLAGLRKDGTLWILRGENLYNWPLPPLEQRGKRTDWIAVMLDWDSDLALANDGTLCRFGEPSPNSRVELLARTRRATWSVNVLDAAQ